MERVEVYKPGRGIQIELGNGTKVVYVRFAEEKEVLEDGGN